MFSMKIEIAVQAESFDYVEKKTAELEDLISSHFDEDELVDLDFQIVEQMETDEIEEEYEE
jgi:hypothetical protein